MKSHFHVCFHFSCELDPQNHPFSTPPQRRCLFTPSLGHFIESPFRIPAVPPIIPAPILYLPLPLVLLLIPRTLLLHLLLATVTLLCCAF